MEDRIIERGGPVQLEAGYPETIASIYEGTVEQVHRGREGLSRVMRLDLTSQVHSIQRLGGLTARSYPGQVSVRQILADIVVADLGLTLGGLGAIPADAVVLDWAWSLDSAGALTALCKRVECTWYEDDGTIRFNRAGRVDAAAGQLVLNQHTGLVGVPSLTEDGAEAVSLLNPMFRIGTAVTVESGTVNGVWKVGSLRHSGDNWRGPFATHLDLRPLA